MHEQSSSFLLHLKIICSQKHFFAHHETIFAYKICCLQSSREVFVNRATDCIQMKATRQLCEVQISALLEYGDFFSQEEEA